MPAITTHELNRIFATEYDSETPRGALECALDSDVIVLEGTITWAGVCQFTRGFTNLQHAYPLDQPEPQEGLAWLNDRSIGLREYEPSGARAAQMLMGGNRDWFLGFDWESLDTLTFGSASSAATVLFTNHGETWSFRLEQPASDRLSRYVRELAFSGADIEVVGRPPQLREDLERSLTI